MAKKKSLHPDSVLLCAQTFCPSYIGGYHAALLHTISCKLYHPGNPKGGGHGTMPPLNSPLVENVLIQKRCLIRPKAFYPDILIQKTYLKKSFYLHQPTLAFGGDEYYGLCLGTIY